jgi:hypothetical protein
MSNLKEGTLVLIDSKCTNTSRAVGINTSMKKMMGKTYKISSIRDSKTVYIGAWIWHINDLITISKLEPIPPELFNPENLAT